jgi:hypothetical protein
MPKLGIQAVVMRIKFALNDLTGKRACHELLLHFLLACNQILCIDSRFACSIFGWRGHQHRTSAAHMAQRDSQLINEIALLIRATRLVQKALLAVHSINALDRESSMLNNTKR